ncbi:MAG: transposase, partial [Nitrosomonas sp.]|nr:transposase [Nitrosomonas sp.]
GWWIAKRWVPGQKVLVYLGRYHRGYCPRRTSLQTAMATSRVPLPEQRNPQMETRTLSGVAFLRLILQHILPKGYRRARNSGFQKPNSKLIPLVQPDQTCQLPTATTPGDTMQQVVAG